MFDVPAAIPNTSPVVDPIVAFDGSLLCHVPPVVVLLSVVVAFTHIAAVPVIAAGAGLIVTLIAASGPQHPPEDCTLK
jgi:hypothetical protein